MTIPLHDPFFLVCLHASAANSDLVREFDRLHGTNLSRRGSGLELAIDDASGRTESDVRQFCEFVAEFVYARVPRPVEVT